MKQHDHLKGYKYYNNAIAILKRCPGASMVEVYTIIADSYSVTPDSVRKALTRYIRKFSYESPARHFKKFWNRPLLSNVWCTWPTQKIRQKWYYEISKNDILIFSLSKGGKRYNISIRTNVRIYGIKKPTDAPPSAGLGLARIMSTHREWTSYTNI